MFIFFNTALTQFPAAQTVEVSSVSVLLLRAALVVLSAEGRRHDEQELLPGLMSIRREAGDTKFGSHAHRD